MVAAGFRSRIASSLLVVAAALPVSLTAGPALALDSQSTPAARPDGPTDDHATDRALPAGRLGELYPGRPGVPDRLPDFPSADDFRDLPDHALDLSGTLPGFPHHPGGPFLHGSCHHRHHPFGRVFPWRSDPPVPGDDSADAGAPAPSDSPSAPAIDPVQLPPGRSEQPTSHDSASSTSSEPGPAPVESALPSSERPRDLAGAPAPSPYGQAPSPSPEREPDNSLAGPEPAASPYAIDAPGTKVERVLPMGAGMALTGLGLAFLGLRLRRR